MFEGIKGTSGVVALDDIEYTIGVNCAKKLTDPVPSKEILNWLLRILKVRPVGLHILNIWLLVRRMLIISNLLLIIECKIFMFMFNYLMCLFMKTNQVLINLANTIQYIGYYTLLCIIVQVFYDNI